MVVRWASESDWDSAVSESGIVHENVENTDYSDASKLRKGYSVKDPLFSSSLVGYWPLHEDSGGTAYDFSGNGFNGQVNGASQGSNGILGASSYSFDGSGDNVSDTVPCSEFSNDEMTWAGWVRRDSTSDDGLIEGGTPNNNDGNQRWGISISNNNLIWQNHGSNSTHLTGSTNLETGKWYFWTVTYSASNIRAVLYLNGSKDGEDNSQNGYSVQASKKARIGSENSSNAYSERQLGGQLQEVRAYNRVLAGDEIQQLYEIAATKGKLTTSVKTS